MKRLIVGLITLSTAVGQTALAHHSYAGFDRDQTVTIVGELETLLFANPHVVLTVRTLDSSRYIAVWRAAYQLERAGTTSDTLRIGDRVAISGSPSRNTADRTITLLTEVQRLSDGWRWVR